MHNACDGVASLTEYVCVRLSLPNTVGMAVGGWPMCAIVYCVEMGARQMAQIQCARGEFSNAVE